MDIAEKICSSCVKFVAKNSDKTEEELEKIEYGLQVIFVNIFKLVILFVIAYMLGIVKYTCIAVISFSSIRTFASGVHADSNLKCTLTNLILFLGNVYLSKNIVLGKNLIIIFVILSLALIILYAPADTEDRPLVSRKLRIRLKIYSIVSNLLLGFIALKCENPIVANIIIFSLLEEAILITPLAYYIFNKKYRNYENIDL